METREVNYPAAIQRRSNKHGYKNDDTLRGEGIVGHSMEGSLAAAFGVLDGPRTASWHFSVAKDGKVYQHLDTTHISYASGSYEANKRFWSIEHEGVAGEPLTVAQTEATADLMGWLLAIKGLPAIRRQTLHEHNEMTMYGADPTACPSGRIPWTEIIAEIEGGDDMTPEQIQQLNNATNDIKTLSQQLADTTALAERAMTELNQFRPAEAATNKSLADEIRAHVAAPHAGGEHEHTVSGTAS